jgi:hypothetical protein
MSKRLLLISELLLQLFQIAHISPDDGRFCRNCCENKWYKIFVYYLSARTYTETFPNIDSILKTCYGFFSCLRCVRLCKTWNESKIYDLFFFRICARNIFRSNKYLVSFARGVCRNSCRCSNQGPSNSSF